ncbi:MAG TPA: peptidoglycan DD-metalloendopeptidase family protein [Nocardioides sp.]|nr:peptidoglycan DD-metalloendopeptidase family protein [Nocardioides sp.]
MTLVALTALIGGLAIPLASASDRDKWKHKQHHVQGQIKDVRSDIDEQSRQVAQISRRLAGAQARLRSARHHLVVVRKDLHHARRTAATLATRLQAAEQRLVVAQAELKSAQDAVALQRDMSRDTVIRMATGGDVRLSALSAYVDSGSIEEVMLEQTAKSNVVGRQNQALVELVGIEKQLAVHEAAVQSARNEVAGAKKAADANVRLVAGLVDKARSTRSTVRALVARTASDRRAVLRARAKDRAALKRLERREASIRATIIRLSRRANGSYNGGTSGFLLKPGPGPVTSPFGYRRHPIYGYWGLHNGIDFGTGCGAPLVAAESGNVINTYYDEVYGNRLYLAIGRVNGASIVLVYNHMSRTKVHGGHVRRGEVVGYSGTTGWSTGCHLHFTVLRNGNPVDPAPYL